MNLNEMDSISVELLASEKSDFQLLFPEKAVGPIVRKWIVAYLAQQKDQLEKLKRDIFITPEPILDPSPSVRKKPGA